MKKIIALSAVAALATTTFASEDVNSRLSAMEKKITKLEKQLKKTKKKLNQVKAHDAGDNIKWDVDFRTAVDKITYKHASGVESKNNSLLTNRLLLGMKFKPEDTVTFYGALSYQKAYGATLPASDGMPQRGFGYDTFDWVANENATDGTIKLKEAYWLYRNDTFFGTDVSWTASVGRRPSTDGLGINFREDQKRKSALAHTVNVEFDGASFRWNLGNVTPMEGSWFKLCMGRGLTNAKHRFSMPNGDDYAEDKTLSKNVDMLGFIFVPYDDGQYSIHTNYAKALHMIGFDSATTYKMMGLDNTEIGHIMDQQMGMPMGSVTPDMLTQYGVNNDQANPNSLQDFGDLDLMTIMFKAEGIGDGINDFLDSTTFFASFAQSKTDPKNGKNMLGSTKSEKGHSVWLGAQMPCPLTEDGRFGVEWNKGSKYWRSVTYGEDTMAGSKIATRGTATEVYWIKPLTKTLTFSARYTKIKYDYTGSNAFFGADGQPMSWTEVAGMRMAGMDADPVKEATDVRAYIRYRF